MADDYTRLAASAARIIQRKGENMTLERKDNAGTPSRPNMVKTTYTVRAAFPERTESDGTNQAAQTATTAYISPTAEIKPAPNDILVDQDGNRYEIGPVTTIGGRGIAALYQAEIGTA